MYITITLNPNDKLYNMNKSKLISLIYDFKNIYDTDVDLLLNSLNTVCFENNHSICFGKNINNKSNIIKCFYQVLKKTINK